MRTYRVTFFVLNAILSIAFFNVVKAQPSFTVPILANDIAYSPISDRIYAGANSQSAQYANSIAVINPANGAVVTSIPIGPNPRTLAFSDDFRFLYVVVDGPRVKRIDIQRGQTDQDFAVDFGRAGCVTTVTQIRVMPGRSETVVISLACPGFSPAHDGIAVYDNGIRRPQISPSSTGARRFCFGFSPDILWGYNTDDDSFSLFKFKIDSQGVSIEKQVGRGLTFAFNKSVEFANGLLYTQNGRVIDPERRTFDGRYYATEVIFASDFALDPIEGSVYFAERDGRDFVLLSFDQKNYKLTGYYREFIANAKVDDIGRLIKCGRWGLAVSSIGFSSSIVMFPFSTLKARPAYVPPQPSPLNDQVRRIPLPSNSIVYDDVHRLLLASTPNWAGEIGNSIVPIDPFTGTVGQPVYAGSEPWQMTVSDQGQYLYVALYGGRAITRYRLPDLTPNLKFPIFTNVPQFAQGFDPGVPITVIELLPVVGNPESVIVLKGLPSFPIPGTNGLAIYDNEKQRRVSSLDGFFPGIMPIDTISLSSTGTTIYGLEAEILDGNNFTTTTIEPDGAYLRTWKRDIGNRDVKLRCQNDLCFTESGIIIDAIAQMRIGRFDFGLSGPNAFYPVSVAPDPLRNRVYFISPDQTGTTLYSFDNLTQKKTGTYRLNGVTGPVGNFLLWGNDQIAFNTDREVVLVPLRLIEPDLPRSSGTPRRPITRDQPRRIGGNQ